MNIVFPPECDKYIGLQCNGDRSLYTNMPEAHHAEKYIKELNPRIAIDLGSGIGRASVYFKNKYNWDTEFVLVDGNCGDKQLDGLREGTKDYYNSWEAAYLFCRANGIVPSFYSPEEEWGDGYRNVDLVYSFLAFGFHWPITQVIDRVCVVLKHGGLAIFGMRGTEESKWVQNQIRAIPAIFKTVEFVQKPKATKESILILRKS